MNTVLPPARQLTNKALTTEAVRPVELKFCVEAEFLESSVALDFISDMYHYTQITNEQVPSLIDERCKESKETVTLEQLDTTVLQKLQVYMKNNNAKVRMQDLFSNYRTLLIRNSLKWILDENQEVTVENVLSAIRSKSIKDFVTNDLLFLKLELRQDFPGFMRHAIRLVEASQLVNNGVPPINDQEDRSARSGNFPNGRKGGQGGSDKPDKNEKGKYKDLPLCLWALNKLKELRHLLKDCRSCPLDEKKKFYAKRSEELAKDGPSKLTRSLRKTTKDVAERKVRQMDKEDWPMDCRHGL